MEVLPLFEAKAYAQARDKLLEMVALFPEMDTAWYKLACAYALLGEPEEAIASLRSPGTGASDDGEDQNPTRSIFRLDESFSAVMLWA